MKDWIGWGLAVAAVAAGWVGYGWRGVALAAAAIRYSRDFLPATVVRFVPGYEYIRLDAATMAAKYMKLYRAVARS